MGNFNGMSWDFSNECSSILQLPRKVTVVWSLDSSKIWLIEGELNAGFLQEEKWNGRLSLKLKSLSPPPIQEKRKGVVRKKVFSIYMCLYSQMVLWWNLIPFATPYSFLPTSSSWSNPGQMFQHHWWWLRGDVIPHSPYKERAYQSVLSMGNYW